jgi:hypothetical protein
MFPKANWGVIMRNGTRFKSVSMLAALGLLSSFAGAEEPNIKAPTETQQPDPAQIDRDGKRICGYSLMTESERGGHRSMLHHTKSLEDRDAIRVDHCARMRKRAQERGVKMEE